jgi:hypothetical protein
MNAQQVIGGIVVAVCVARIAFKIDKTACTTSAMVCSP